LCEHDQENPTLRIISGQHEVAMAQHAERNAGHYISHLRLAEHARDAKTRE
jgi:hypothetical protein